MAVMGRFSLTAHTHEELAINDQEHQYYQQSNMIVVEFSRFNCKGYWSLSHSLCQPTCRKPLNISNTLLCLDSHRLLPKDPPAPSGTPIACPGSYTLCISCLKLTATE
jgi:hypothetical protein